MKLENILNKVKPIAAGAGLLYGAMMMSGCDLINQWLNPSKPEGIISFYSGQVPSISASAKGNNYISETLATPSIAYLRITKVDVSNGTEWRNILANPIDAKIDGQSNKMNISAVLPADQYHAVKVFFSQLDVREVYPLYASSSTAKLPLSIIEKNVPDNLLLNDILDKGTTNVITYSTADGTLAYPFDIEAGKSLYVILDIRNMVFAEADENNNIISLTPNGWSSICVKLRTTRMAE